MASSSVFRVKMIGPPICNDFMTIAGKAPGFLFRKYIFKWLFFSIGICSFSGAVPSLDGRKPCVFPCCLGWLLLAALGFSCIAWRPRNGTGMVGQRGESFLAIFGDFCYFLGDFLQQMMSLWLDFGGVYFGKKDPNSTYISSVLEYFSVVPWALCISPSFAPWQLLYICRIQWYWPSKLR